MKRIVSHPVSCLLTLSDYQVLKPSKGDVVSYEVLTYHMHDVNAANCRYIYKLTTVFEKGAHLFHIYLM